MADYKYTPRDIYEMDFDTKMRGYDKDQVDEMLDNVIVDYEAYAAEVLKLKEENEFLKNRVSELEGGRGVTAAPAAQVADLDQTQRFETQSQAQPAQQSEVKLPFPQHTANLTGGNSSEPSNFELLKRINRLERAVFGPDSRFGEN